MTSSWHRLETVGLAVVLAAGCAASKERVAAPPQSASIAAAAVNQPLAAPAPEPTASQSGVQQAAYQPPPVTVAEPIPPAPPADTQPRPGIPIDFATALGLTYGQNPRIGFAQAQIEQAFAQYSAARVLWLPSIRSGMNYNKHEGRLQDVEGINREISRGAAYGGLGAAAVGAGSPAVPGVVMQFRLADAIYQPRIAEANLDAREQFGTAVTNDQLLATALAYLDLLEALQREAIAGETLRHGEELAKLTAEFARTGAGNQADADRAAAALALFRNEAVRAQQDVEIATARLAQQLSADPTVVLAPQEPNVVPIELVKPGSTVQDLVALGLANRPELFANRALVDEAISRLRREEHSLWLPSVALGASYGAFGTGRGGEVIHGGDRFDFDAVAWWELRNLGFGERAARENARAQIQQARMREVETLDLVAREVAEAYAEAEDRRPITTAEEGINLAQQSYERNLERIRNAQGLPIEVLQSIQALDQARREYLRSVVEYNQAQFRLHRALGWPINGSEGS